MVTAMELNFNSRTSCEVRLQYPFAHSAIRISTHAPLARCDITVVSPSQFGEISTHAPLARCDKKVLTGVFNLLISTHAPLARCDWMPAWLRA